MIRRVNGEQWLAVAVIVLGLIMAWQITAIPADAGYAGIGPRFFPTLIVTGLVMCGGILLLQSSKPPATPSTEEENEGPRADADWSQFVLLSGSLLAHMALIGLIGFTLAGTMLCFGVCRALASTRPWRDALLSFLLVFGLFHLFAWLGLNLPALIPGVL